jgi:ketosteroid isomerase-like protein
MRRRILMLLACGALCLPGAEPDFKAHLQKVLDAWTSLDIQKPAPYYSKDPQAVFFDVAPMKYTGWTEYADGFSKFFIPMAKSAKVTIGDDFRTTKLGKHLLATFTAKFQLEEKSGKQQEFNVRFTELLEQRGKEWIIIHEHVSAPLGN